jgi:outer membrane biosynthesis protein TonB
MTTTTERAKSRTARKTPVPTPESDPKVDKVKAKVKPKPKPKPKPVLKVEPKPVSRPVSRSRAPFVLLVIGLLGGALVCLLILNTVLARDAYTMTELKTSNNRLHQQAQELAKQNAQMAAPKSIAQMARSMGMVQPNQPAFVDLTNGRVTGGTVRPVPTAAAAAAAAARVVGVPGAIVPGDGIPGWTGALPETKPAEAP